jgi:NAD(P)-dependent dehydrogenase (short-subunit alcohol dehydrogenase family)
MQLENKVAVVTGAAKGMGRAIALGYAQEGAAVVLADIDEPGARQVAAEIDEADGKSLVVNYDVADIDAAPSLVAQTVSEFGALDILVNNAGIGLIKKIWEYTSEEWDRLFAVNVKGLFFLSSEASKQMIEQKSGKMVNLASVSGRDVDPMAACYCATKASVISITQSFAKALAPYGITVNGMAPGIVDTPYWKQVDLQYGAILGKKPGEFWDEISKLPLLGRPSVPTDVVALAIFLAGPGSDYITGQTIGIDGGIIMV